MFVAAPAVAGPVDVVVDCTAVDREAAAELEARLRLEADLNSHWTGRLHLDCQRGRALVRHFRAGDDMRERAAPLHDAPGAAPAKDVLLELALTLLDEAPTEAHASGTNSPRDARAELPTDRNASAPPGAESDESLGARRPAGHASDRTEPPVDTQETAPGGGAPSFVPTPALWALDAGLAYEHFGGGALGAASVELGGARSLGPSLAIHVGASAGVGVQSPAGLQSRVAAGTVQLELRVVPWLVVGGGPLYSFASFMGDRSLGHHVSVSRQWGGQLDLSLAPAGMSSGPMIGVRSRLYAQERSVRVDLAEVLRIPSWTFTLTLGYRFFGGRGAAQGTSKRAR